MAVPRALVPAAPRAIERSRRPISLLRPRALPVVVSVATVTLVGLAAEQLLRAGAMRLVDALPMTRVKRRATAVVTEITVIERFRRG
ncbi:MAG: hypothetical protein AB7I38_04255 [Dehalococcoidia bacterium]